MTRNKASFNDDTSCQYFYEYLKKSSRALHDIHNRMLSTNSAAAFSVIGEDVPSAEFPSHCSW